MTLRVAARALRVLRDHGILDGRKLADMAGVDYDQLGAALQELQKLDLVDVKGDVRNPRRVPFAHVAYRPSNDARVEKFLQRSES